LPITEAVDLGLVIADVRESSVTAREPAGQTSEIHVSREVAYTLRSLIYLFIYLFSAPSTQFPKAEILNYENYVWNGQKHAKFCAISVKFKIRL